MRAAAAIAVGLRSVADRLSEVSERVVPSPFLFALVLTYLVFVTGTVVMDKGAVEMLRFWYGGFWGLLEFGMQMVLIIATGFVLVYHPYGQRSIAWLAGVPSDGKRAVILVGLVSMASAWLHWGFGLIVGAVFAREMGRHAHRRGLAVHYPMLGTAGFMGLGATWHLGLSGSAPLIMNTPKNVFIGLGLVDGVLSPSQTIFHPYAVLLLLAAVGTATVLLYLVSPCGEDAKGVSHYLPADRRPRFGQESDAAADGGTVRAGTVADRVNRNRVIGGLVALGGVTMTGYTFATRGLGALTFNVINFGLLFVGLALYTRPTDYQEEFYEAVTATAGIILQFPFYAGIIGMMNRSGLSRTVAELLLSTATETTFPAVTWLTAVLVNVFVPSGGAEWNVIGGAVLSNASELGVPPGKAVIAFSLGDAVGNLVQPFWMIPLLGITGLRARDVFGYAVTVILVMGPVLAVCLVVIPY